MLLNAIGKGTRDRRMVISLKAADPAMGPREMQDKIEAKRPEFKQAAKAACARK